MKGQKKPTITVDTDEGTTPFMIGCKATPGCDGTAQSMFYRLPHELQQRAATHEWYRPTATEAKRLKNGTKEHVRLGGLLLREAGKVERDQLEFA